MRSGSAFARVAARRQLLLRGTTSTSTSTSSVSIGLSSAAVPLCSGGGDPSRAPRLWAAPAGAGAGVARGAPAPPHRLLPHAPWQAGAASCAFSSSSSPQASASAAGIPLSEGAPPHLGPSVKILLEASGLNPHSIPGTGPHGIITKGDVLAAIAKGGAARQPSTAPHTPVPPRAPLTTPPPRPPSATAAVVPPPAAPAHAPLSPPGPEPVLAGISLGLPPAKDIPTSQLRRIIAQRLLESKLGSPHFYAEAEAVIDATLALRKQLKASGISVSVNDFVIKAVAAALQKVPEARVLWDDKQQAVTESGSIDIAVAVATEKGLFTPIVKAANTKSLGAISEEVKSLASRARAGSLKPEEFQGGVFTISNLGMFPIDRFSAIINPPQPCILAVGRGERVARWVTPPASPEALPSVVTKMEVTLSADARAVGANVAGKFLAAFVDNLQDPLKLMA